MNDMTDFVNDIQTLPLWFTIPLGIIYVALIIYFFYILWHYRRTGNLF